MCFYYLTLTVNCGLYMTIFFLLLWIIESDLLRGFYQKTGTLKTLNGFLLHEKSMSFILLRRTHLNFVDNFSFLTQTGNAGQPPVRRGSQKNTGNVRHQQLSQWQSWFNKSVSSDYTKHMLIEKALKDF